MSNPVSKALSTPHFVLARAGTKAAIWPDYPNRPATLKQAGAHKAAGGLVGFYPGSLGYVCVDVDLPPALKGSGSPDAADYVAKARAALVERLGEPAVEQPTGSGGLHCFYAVETARAVIRNGKWKLDGFTPGDIRGDNGYAIIYRPGLIADLQEASMFAAPLDMARLDAIRTRRQDPDPEGVSEGETWAEGERNDSFKDAVAGAAMRGDMPGVKTALDKVLRSEANGKPYKPGEIDATLLSALRYGLASDRYRGPPVTAADFPDDAMPWESLGGMATGAELLAMDPEETRWIIEELIPAAGLTVLAGSPFDGKSTWSRDLSASVAAGRRFLDMATERGRVLHVALQDKPGALQRWFRALDLPADDSALVVWRWKAAGKPVDTLREAIQAQEASLVVVDTLARFTAGKDVLRYSEIEPALHAFHELAHDMGVAILMIHHTRKPGRDGPEDAVESVLGSQAIAGVADSLLTLRRLDDSQRVLEARHRDAPDLEPTVLHMDAAGRFTLGGSVEDAAQDAACEAVLAALATHGELSASELREAAKGLRHAAVTAARDSLVVRGEIETRRDGRADKYKLVEGPEDDF